MVQAISQKEENQHFSATITPENTAREPLQPRICQGQNSKRKFLSAGRCSVAPYRSFPPATPTINAACPRQPALWPPQNNNSSAPPSGKTLELRGWIICRMASLLAQAMNTRFLRKRRKVNRPVRPIPRRVIDMGSGTTEKFCSIAVTEEPRLPPLISISLKTVIVVCGGKTRKRTLNPTWFPKDETE